MPAASQTTYHQNFNDPESINLSLKFDHPLTRQSRISCKSEFLYNIDASYRMGVHVCYGIEKLSKLHICQMQVVLSIDRSDRGGGGGLQESLSLHGLEKTYDSFFCIYI